MDRGVRHRCVAFARCNGTSLFAMALLLVLSLHVGAQTAPGGVYLGYYQEDPTTNPEDPVPGALYLALPADDSMFVGKMFFTYIGCQTTSIGGVSGVKSGLSLTGRWSGPVDGTQQRGTFSGVYDSSANRYIGTYAVDGGKQFIDRQPCIQYYIAPNGAWELFAVGQNVPTSFVVGLNGTRVSWPAIAGSALALLSIFDVSFAANEAGSNALKWQTLLFSSPTSFDLASVGQTLGPNDVVTVTVFDSLQRRLAFASKASSTQTVSAVEYFHSQFGHYFVTAIADEIVKLDNGVFVGWQRTQQKFNVYPVNTAGRSNVCRFFSTSFGLKSSHFYTPLATECMTVTRSADWQFEGEVFAVGLPDASGNCATGTQPLYRLYNDGQGGAPNHRYTTSPTTRAAMLGQQWIPEGNGAAGVVACVPN